MTVSEAARVAGSADARRAGVWFIVEGVLIAALGAFAALLPALAGVAAALVFGWMLLLAGVVGLIGLFVARRRDHPVWRAVSALVTLVAGALVLWAPLAGVLSLALLIAAYLVLNAGASLAMAFDHRKRTPGGWIWPALSALVGLVLAGFIILLRPAGAAVLVGFLVAINLFAGGVSLVGLGIAARRRA